MSNNEPQSVSLPLEEPLPVDAWSARDRDSFVDPVECLPEIALAGAAYPVIVAGIGLPFVIYYEIAYMIRLGIFMDSAILLVQSLLMLLTFCVFGMTIALFVGLFTLGFFSLANWTLGQPLSQVALVSCAGGLAGYIPMSAMFLAPEVAMTLKVPGTVVAFAIGPCLALLVGQTFARNSFRRIGVSAKYNILTFEKSQFQISTILAFTFWCAVLMTISRLLIRTNFVWLLVVYILMQILALLSANAIAKSRRKSQMGV